MVNEEPAARERERLRMGSFRVVRAWQYWYEVTDTWARVVYCKTCYTNYSPNTEVTVEVRR